MNLKDVRDPHGIEMSEGRSKAATLQAELDNTRLKLLDTRSRVEGLEEKLSSTQVSWVPLHSLLHTRFLHTHLLQTAQARSRPVHHRSCKEEEEGTPINDEVSIVVSEHVSAQ